MDSSELLKYTFASAVAVGLFILKIVFDFAKEKPSAYKAFVKAIKPLFFGSYLLYLGSSLTSFYFRNDILSEVLNPFSKNRLFVFLAILALFATLKLIDITARKWGESNQKEEDL